MTRTITPKQALRINRSLYPTLGYLNLLEQWLRKLGFPATDEYCRTVAAARDAIDRLTISTHHLSGERKVERSEQS